MRFSRSSGRLQVRPGPRRRPLPELGLSRIDWPDVGTALRYLPPQLGEADGADTLDPAVRLVVALHGAGGHPPHALAPWLPAADELGLLIVAPQSTESSWDLLHGGYGPDRDLVDALLADTAEFAPVLRLAPDHTPARTVLAGFSDGASYALSLGLDNGDLFDAIVAFSPGFAAPAEFVDRPRIFVSHGDADRVLPIARCSDVLVPRLRAGGWDVEYERFHGGHTVPPEVVAAALRWLGWTSAA